MTDDRPEIDAGSLADAFEDYDPQPEDFDAPIGPVMEARLAAFRHAAAEKKQRMTDDDPEISPELTDAIERHRAEGLPGRTNRPRRRRDTDRP